MPAPIITLTTDFGLSDGYVAAIKGVILSRTASANIIDICHDVAPQNISQAAWVVKDTFIYFPKGSIHVIVVDPGVGSDRAIVGMSAHGHYFLGPDNGVLSPFIEPEAKAFLAQRPDLYQSPVSRTFHGRDIFAPLAAHLAAGNPIDSIGKPIHVDLLQRLILPEPTINMGTGQITGCIIKIDHFGNLITNISSSDLLQLGSAPTSICIDIKDITLSVWRTHYSEMPPGQPLILINSSGLVEIAINQGHAEKELGIRINTPIILSVCEKDN